jgi:Tesmin/TSO1-like CXC domain, cysteine-rich domain
MEDSSLREYNSNQHVQKDENTSRTSERKINKLEVAGSSDATMNENDFETQSKTMSQSPQPAPPLQQSLIGATMSDNKENLVRNQASTSMGDSQPLPNAYFPPQPSEQHVDCTRHDDDPYAANICPPMMLYTNSLAFSDTSMPFPSLAASKSFGPNGILHCNHNHGAAPITQFSRHSSLGQQVFNPSLSQLHTPDLYKHNVPNPQSNHENSWKHSCNEQTTVSDLNIAASALLDLTPATTHKDRFNHTQPQMNDVYINNEINGLVCDQQEHVLVPIFQQNESFQVNIDNSTHVNLNVPTRARMESRAQDLLNAVPYTLQACKCKNSRCLKLYCACFQQGTFCDELVCYCRKCENTKKHSNPRGSRTRAIYEILNRRIDAFEPRERRQTGNGCSCRKSKYVYSLSLSIFSIIPFNYRSQFSSLLVLYRCLQKYCDCFSNGDFCSGLCSCYGCENKNTSSSHLPVDILETVSK